MELGGGLDLLRRYQVCWKGRVASTRFVQVFMKADTGQIVA